MFAHTSGDGGRARFARRVAVAVLLSLASACSSAPTRHRPPVPAYSHTPTPQPEGIQCAPYAREHSKVRIFGDASTWWDKAKGRYARRDYPTPGAIMVLYQYAGPARAHVAVIRRITGAHELRIDHANWLNDGKIYLNDPVRDASGDRDWRSVNVFNMQTGHWGSRSYAVQGFIGPDADTGAADVPISSVDDWLRQASYETAEPQFLSDADW